MLVFLKKKMLYINTQTEWSKELRGKKRKNQNYQDFFGWVSIYPYAVSGKFTIDQTDYDLCTPAARKAHVES